MLSAYVNASDMEGAEKFFRRLKQDGFVPNVITYGTLIKGYAKVNNLEKMMEIYDKMRVNGIKPNQTIFTTIMDEYGKNKDFDSAVVWYKEMESCGFPPDQKAKNILLSLAKTADERNEANELLGNFNHPNNEPGINGLSISVDEEDDDDDDDEDDDDNIYHDGDGDGDGDDNEDDAEETIACSGKEDELIFFNGDHQRSQEGLHTLQTVDL